ncbi:MAG: hypothetical protein ACLUKN_06945 [Bacilli bacterium]
MKLPPDRFEELVSLYLDNEASDAELRTLVECVKSDPEAAKKLKNLSKYIWRPASYTARSAA